MAGDEYASIGVHRGIRDQVVVLKRARPEVRISVGDPAIDQAFFLMLSVAIATIFATGRPDRET